ncbi:MAG: glycine cleavage system aminomethyltransferase GcvT [Acidobacteria bacterium]|nr:glycine cleavage system aminomethyltransferase GcvT [Acidobacteriota bacterium]
MDNLKKTPLTETHRSLGGKMVPFAGYEMPVQFSSTMEEHLAVRKRVGLFDVSHMGEVFIEGPDALALVQKLTCNNAEKLADGQIQYSGLMTLEGTFVDDLLVHRFSDRKFMLCVNASNRGKDVAWILEHKEGDARVEDRSDAYTQIAIQGPKALETLQPLTDVDLSAIKYYWFREGRVDGEEAIIARTGYTGEDGFEIYFAPGPADRIWRKLLETGKPFGVIPCGLACRNTLRLEAKMALYGNDIDDTTTVLEADLGWICKLKKGEFNGREALQKQADAGVKRKLAGFEMTGKAPARDHYPVYADGVKVSDVTSGSYAPYLEKNIGLVYLPVALAQPGTPIQVEIRGRLYDAVVVPTPFYKRNY